MLKKGTIRVRLLAIGAGLLGSLLMVGCSNELSPEQKADRDMEIVSEIADICQMGIYDVFAAESYSREVLSTKDDRVSSLQFKREALEMVRSDNYKCDALQDFAHEWNALTD